ncbi:hypothetical protein QQP08_000156, partial [Theobroma cacao]
MVEGTGGLAMPKLEPLEVLRKGRSVKENVLIQASIAIWFGKDGIPEMGLADPFFGFGERVNEKAIDMVYGTGAALSKAEPLEALCKARSIMNNLLVQPG